MIDVQETAIRAGDPFTQSTPTTRTNKAGVRVATSQPRCSSFGVLKSEQVRLWSLRVAQVTAVLVLVPMTIINLLVLLFTDVSGGIQLLAVDTTARVSAAIDLILIVVLNGVLAAGELSTGSIRPSLGAVPSRGLFVTAKVMVFAPSMLILSILAVGINVVLGLIVLPARGVKQSLESPVVRTIVGLYLYSVLMGLSSFCTGLLGRSGTGAISVTLGILWIPSSVVRMPDDGKMARAVMARLPGVTGSQAFALESTSSTDGT